MKRILFLSVLLVVASCTKYEMASPGVLIGENCDVVIEPQMAEVHSTRTHFDSESSSVLWNRLDQMGVIASYDDNGTMKFTDTNLRYFKVSNALSYSDYVKTALFGGQLTNKGAQTYTYYGVYPYKAMCPVTDITAVDLLLPGVQHPDGDSWDRSCDFLVAQPCTISGSTVASNNVRMRFAHVFGFLRLSFGESLLSAYGDERVETITIEAGENDRLAGNFSLDLSAADGPSFVMKDNALNSVKLDYRNTKLDLASLGAATFVLAPGEYAKVKITLETEEHTIIMERENLSLKSSQMISAKLNSRSGDKVETAKPLIPRKEKTDGLKVLLFGHSFGIDALTHLPHIVKAAGIDNAVIAFLYYPNCYLHQHWDFMTNPAAEYTYWKAVDGVEQGQRLGIYWPDVIEEEDWDVVCFQQGTEFEGEYSTFQPYLNNLIAKVTEISQAKHNKVPVFGWHLFWPYGKQFNWDYFARYGYDQNVNFHANINACREMMDDIGIELVVSTCATIQNLRTNSLGVDHPYEYTRDHWHLDYGSGRYAASCTWYETIFEPCYGISVLGNSYVTPGCSFQLADNSNKEVFQRVAVASVKNPFELTRIEALPEAPTPPASTTGGSSEGFTIDSEIENW